jgi:hypothetical protein
MGVLDDAIREHLELKRSRGATDDEIARDEAEALGPARREPAADPNAGFVEALSEETAVAEPPPPPPPAPAAEEEALAPVEVPPLERPAAIDEPTAVHEPPAHAPEPPVEEELEPDEVPAEERLAAPRSNVSAETAEYDALADVPPGAGVEDELDDDRAEAPVAPLPPPPDDPSAPPAPARPAGVDADGDEDLLEETPEFLQETPEHDRLWFEQKPPRDFDFDD